MNRFGFFSSFENSYRIWDDESSTEISSPRFNVVLDGNTFALDKNLSIEGDGYNGSGKVGILVIDSESNDNIFLRSDNADLRLMEMGDKAGLVDIVEYNISSLF